MSDNETGTPTVSPAKLANIMAQVNNMLAKAEDESCTEAERQQNRERAEVLMTRYRIAEANLSELDRARMGIKPQRSTWWVAPLGGEFTDAYRTLCAYVVAHVDARGVSEYAQRDGQTWIVYQVFGFESDLAYGEAVWNSIRLGFKSLLEPEYNASLSDMENVYAMRNAGMERVRIAEVMGWPYTGAAHAKVTRLFKQACAERGEDASALLGRQNNVKTFRASYAEAFNSRMWQRLYTLRSTRGADSVALTLGNRKEAIDEALYEAYPFMRPSAPKVQIGHSTSDGCAKCLKAKSGYCKAHAWLKPRAYRDQPYSRAGAARGRDAAGSVNLGGTGGSLER